ncbi:MAG TPA: glycosyltransferase [Marmoricola sp.]|jgi:glycosyltransferase involved in cell wall biosynthesis|nr:glycosyltransferase [Marmoricola sp.]
MTDLRGSRVVVANWRDLDHSLAGGAERYAWELSLGLVEAGARVDFLTARDVGQSRTEMRDGIRIVRRGGRLSYYVLAALWLLVRRGSVDAVVDLESGIPQFSPLVVSRRRTGLVLVVHHVHLDQFGLYFPAPVAWLGRFLEGTVMPRVYADVTTVAVSESTRQAMVTRLGWTGPISILHNGSNPPLAVSAAEEDTVDRVVVLGRLAPQKRIDLVIRAVAALQISRPALHLDIIGKGPDQERLAALVRDLDIEKHVTLHGYVTEAEKAALLGRSRLHVCASDAEGWGQVVLEAAGYGVPTLARDVPGLRDSIRDASTGWLLPEPATDLSAVQARLVVGIDEALAQLGDPELRADVSAAATAWAARFDWKNLRTGATALVALTMKGGS